jgi:hypothetical protein
MESKKLSVGADRFLALEWANFAYDLFMSTQDQMTARNALRVYLEGQIEGKESSRKTANQLNRLWLSSDDACVCLRDKSRLFSSSTDASLMAVLHLGLAVNVFPIYKQTVRVIGTLVRIADTVSVKAIIPRVMERFPNPSSIPRLVTRVLQTLKDWRFIDLSEGKVAVRDTPLLEAKLVNWFLLALLQANSQSEITLRELENNPLKLGINFTHPRSVVNQSEDLVFSRNDRGLEVVRTRQENLN